jgi:hypothetical protein
MVQSDPVVAALPPTTIAGKMTAVRYKETPVRSLTRIDKLGSSIAFSRSTRTVLHNNLPISQNSRILGVEFAGAICDVAAVGRHPMRS